MAYDVIHKNSTVAGTPPTAGEVEVGEIAINAADAALYTKDTNGAIQEFISKFVRSDAGATPRVLSEKFADIVSVKDFGAVGDGVSDDLPAFQAAVDTAPAIGREILVPSGSYRFLTGGLKLDGTASDKSNIKLKGMGQSSYIWLDGSVKVLGPSGLPSDYQTPDVISARTGSSFTLDSLRIESNVDKGGIFATYTSAWKTSTTYTYKGSDVYVSTNADGTFESPATASGRVWRLLATHTSDATNILVDVALGRWVEITDGTALNRYYSDEQFNRNNCVHFSALPGDPPLESVTVINCDLSRARFAQLMVGSGPALEDLPNAGVVDSFIQNNYLHDGSAGVGGLARRASRVIGNRFRSLTGNQINFDATGGFSVCAFNDILGGVDSGLGEDEDRGRNGVSAYQSGSLSIVGNIIQNINFGIICQDPGNNAEDIVISSNVIDSCSTGIVVNSVPSITILGNSTKNCDNDGIKVGSSNGCSVSSNTAESNGRYGINLEDTYSFLASSNICRSNGARGIQLSGIRRGSVTGNSCTDNGATPGAISPTCGIGLSAFGSTDSIGVIFTGNATFDALAGSLKVQEYGLVIDTSQAFCLVGLNAFTGNKIGEILDNGINNARGMNASITSGSWRFETPLLPLTTGGSDLGAPTVLWGDGWFERVRFIDANGPFDLAGTGSPEGVVSARIGSTYRRNDGSTGTSFYVKESNAGGNTGWTAK